MSRSFTDGHMEFKRIRILIKFGESLTILSLTDRLIRFDSMCNASYRKLTTVRVAFISELIQFVAQSKHSFSHAACIVCGNSLDTELQFPFKDDIFHLNKKNMPRL